jgi:hypothetical protein
MLEKILIVVATAIITAIISEVIHRLRGRRQLVEDVAERYVAETHTAHASDTPAVRLGTMQRAGVALLKSRKEFSRFIMLVIGRGCTHPLKDSDIEEYVPIAKLPTFLLAASERGISLSDDIALFDFLLSIMYEAEQQKTKESRP